MKIFIEHLRLPFQFALSPFFCLGVLMSGHPWTVKIFIDYLIVHTCLYGGSTVFNSYYDRDKGPVAFIKNPRPVSLWMKNLSIIFQLGATGWVALHNDMAGWIAGIMTLMSIGYSHPLLRWKKNIFSSLLVVGLGQGALAVLLGFFLSGGNSLHGDHVVSLIGSMLLAIAFYFITQIFQVDEDRERGDQTISVLLGEKITLSGAWVLVAVGSFLLLHPWISWKWRLLPGILTLPILWRWSLSVLKTSNGRNHDIAVGFVVLSSALTLLLFIWIH